MDYSLIVATGDLEKLKAIAEFIVESHPFKITTEPSPGMVMIRVIDPLEKTPFYLGEAFVTQCEVEIDGNLGYGCVMGYEEERALYGAILDAIMGNDHELASKVRPMLALVEKEILQRYEKETKKVARTRVNFDVKKG
ncbi:MAG: phosphonate lyase system protein PhnG [Peptococcaceae bacterium]|jgi:alpha-D-ribose 1-methylphosphonate 5-triphosphate synthase subunit PhnG|nr:phosphonate lyase system protein PhnG [Peptococcaceae bacterium]